MDDMYLGKSDEDGTVVMQISREFAITVEGFEGFRLVVPAGTRWEDVNRFAEALRSDAARHVELTWEKK